MKYIPISLIFIFCFICGGILFKFFSPHQCPPLLPNDTIFVLTGDARRIPYAIKKLDSLQDGNLFIIGAGTTNIENTKNIKLETKSKSTYQNAIAIKKIVSTRKLDRIILITTEDHISRALFLLSQEIPNTDIITCPVALTEMPVHHRLKRWTIEYVKYIFTLLGIKES